MKYFLLFVLLISVAAAGYLFISNSRKKTENQAVQTKNSTPASTTSAQQAKFDKIQASFAIFTNGLQRSFDNPKYHKLSPNVFITAQNPNIITATIPGVTWNEFFLSLPMRLNPECLTTGDDERFCNGPEGKISFYINGVEDKRALIKPIKQGDTFLVSFGNETEEQIKAQVGKIPKLPQN